VPVHTTHGAINAPEIDPSRRESPRHPSAPLAHIASNQQGLVDPQRPALADELSRAAHSHTLPGSFSRTPEVAQQVSAAFADHLGAERYSRYFVRPWAFTSGGWLEIPVASAMMAQLCQQHFLPVLVGVASRIGHRDLAVRFVVAADAAATHTFGKPASSPRGLNLEPAMASAHPAAPLAQQRVTAKSAFSASPAASPAASAASSPAPGSFQHARPTGPLLPNQPVQITQPVAVGFSAAPAETGRSNRDRTDVRTDVRTGSRQHPGSTLGPVAPRYRLEQLVVGPSNRMALDAVSRVGQRSSEGLQIVTLFGGCGVGKTHLLHAAAESLRAARPGVVVRMVTGEMFVNDFLGSLRGKSVEGFRKSLRTADLLCIDDADFIAGKSATQIELQHTIDAITSRGGSVVVSAAVHPSKLTGFSPALASRLSGGMCVPVLPPDDQTLQRLVRVLASRRGLVIEEQAMSAVMAAASPANRGVNIRELEGVLTRLDAVARLLDAPTRAGTSGNAARSVGLVAVHKAVGQSSAAPAKRAIRMEEILRTVCLELSVSLVELAGSGRHPRVVIARALCTALARKLTDLSYPEIARGIGRPNHSTVITANQRLTGQIAACLSVDGGPRHGTLEIGLLWERLLRIMQP